MKVFLLAVVAAIALAALSFWALPQFQQNAWTGFSTEGVRLGDPGHNLLVGEAVQRGPDQAHARE